MRSLEHIVDESDASRFAAELESALLAQALADTGGLPDERTKALLRQWLVGTFDAASANLLSIIDGRGALDWKPEGDGYRLVWYAPTGLACPLARIYAQADGSWAALIVAGVRDDAQSAMLAAEWGVSRLAA
jgi:hypothetical protein